MKYTTGILIIVAILLATGAACAQTPFGDGFETGTLTSYLQNTVSGITLGPDAGTTGNCLRFAKGITGTYKFVKVAVTPETKYAFTFRSKVVGDDVIEKNERIDSLQVANYGLLIRWQMQFFDAAGTQLTKQRNFGDMTLVSGEWRSTTDVFYTPANAVQIQISFVFGTAEDGLMLDDMTLGLSPDEGAINCNPTFACGRYVYSGWQSIQAAGLLLPNASGALILDTAYGTTGETFPVSTAGTYRLFVRAANVYGGYHPAIVRLYNAAGTLLGSYETTGSTAGSYRDFPLPAGTAYASFLVYNHHLQEIRLTRIGN